MKPSAPAFGSVFPLAAGLAALPLLIESPLWGVAATLGASAWAYADWRRVIDCRPPLPELSGETFAPLDASISWRTMTGEFPASRRGWRAVLTEGDLWLTTIRPNLLLGGDRDYVRVPRLDVVDCDLVSDAEVRVRFLDEDGRAQELRLSHVPQASALALALGHAPDRGTSIADLGPLG